MATASRLRSWIGTGSNPSAMPEVSAAQSACNYEAESARVASTAIRSGAGQDRGGTDGHRACAESASRTDRGRPVRLSTQDHARALLAWMQADPNCRGLLTSTEVSHVYDEMVVAMNILPRGWGGVSRELTRLLAQPKLRIEEGGRRPRAFNIERPGDASPIDRIVAAAAVIGAGGQQAAVAA